MSDIRSLQMLSEKFPNRKAATGEIINLRAILALPKGTEYFLSDLHGEHEAFEHMIRSASGVIKSKIEEVFADKSDEQRTALASLVYNAEAEIMRRKKSEKDFDAWCKEAIYDLIQIGKSCSTKYSRSRVKSKLPKYWDYSINELLNADDEANRAYYYEEIIQSIVDSDFTTSYIKDLANAVSALAVDSLHIIGDIWDRGAHPEEIMDYLISFDNVDIQWGNHDMVWMGAATGNWACITNVLRMNISYNNFDMLEVGYGINLRNLSAFAQEVYGDDPCEFFMPKVFDKNKYDKVSEELAAKMHKAIAICQFKVEGQRIKAHPEYKLDGRLLLDKIDYENGTIEIKGETYELRDKNFPTIDPDDPYKLTAGEENLLKAMTITFLKSERLQRHMRFLYSHGSLYKVTNNNLLYHGCIPMEEDGSFKEIEMYGKKRKGKEYMDYLDDQIRKEYYDPDSSDQTVYPGDLMWYLWLGKSSPLFGKDQMTTFERLFIADKKTHKENVVPYYTLIKEKKPCEDILAEFGIDPKLGHILNGHVPVKIKDGETPIKGEGKLIVIDGGISKAYQKTTGIAGYTYIYNSRYTALAEHKPYTPLNDDGTQQFHDPVIRIVEELPKRVMIKDTETGKRLEREIGELRELIEAYKKGYIKEVY